MTNPYLVLILTAAIGWRDTDAPLDGSQLSRVLQACQAPIQDYELVIEGQQNLLRETQGEFPGEFVRSRNFRFQTNYAYRCEDGATYFEVYRHYFDPKQPPTRSIFAILNHRLSEVHMAADRQALKPMPVESPGGPGANKDPGTAERIVYLWFWRRLIDRPSVEGYEFEGWEDIDGHRCLRASFSAMRSRGLSPTSVRRFWFDLQRGGHVLKYESVHGDKVGSRAYNIELAQFSLPGGQQVWFPVRGVFDTHTWKGEIVSEPTLRETYTVVAGSLVFNQGLRDERFTVDWRGKKVETPELKEAKQEFAKTPQKSPPLRLRIDPTGVAEWQREKLAEADRQARQLDASAPSSRFWSATTGTQVTLVGLGAALIVAALVRRRAG